MTAPRGFPVFLDVSQRPPLVVGEGALAVAKVNLLRLRAPKVLLATGHPPSALAAEIEAGAVVCVEPSGIRETLRRCSLLVIVPDAINDVNLQHATALSSDARSLGVPVNVADRPELSTASLGAIVNRDPVTVAIGTDGCAPILATNLRTRIESLLPPGIGRLAKLAGRMRTDVTATIGRGRKVHAFWRSFFGHPAAHVLQTTRDGDRAVRAEVELTSLLAAIPHREPAGEVVLVGAGPGDPELLTVAAVRVLKRADVIFHDRLPGAGFRSVARREAECIAVGKRKGFRNVPQAEIVRQMIDRARRGETVVRLKGGDPSIFGRGGEEIAALDAARIPVTVVPGITSVCAAASSLRISLTHRSLARTLTLVSGHAPETGVPDFGDLDFRSLSKGRHALAVYMGLTHAGSLATRLLADGWVPETPVLALENVSDPGERRIRSTILDMAAGLDHLNLSGPVLILVGDFASQVRSEAVELLRPHTGSPPLSPVEGTALRTLMNPCHAPTSPAL